MQQSRSAKVLALACTLVLLAACADKPTAPVQQFEKFGGGTARVIIPSAVMLKSVTPNPATVPVGLTQQFSAFDVNGAAKPANEVTWSVSGGGMIDTTGLFTAGAAAGTFTLLVKDKTFTLADLTPVTVSVPITVTATTPAGTCSSDDDKSSAKGKKHDDHKGSAKGHKDDDDKKDCDNEKDHKDSDKDKDKDHG